MELKDFISETLKNIISGVKDAQEQAIKDNASINPFLLHEHTALSTRRMRVDDKKGSGNEYSKIYTVEFDIAVIASSGNESSIGAKINVFSMGIGGKIKDTDKNETTSRIKFHIDVAMPNQ